MVSMDTAIKGRDVTSRVLTPTREELLTQRKRLLGNVSLSREELESAAKAGTLTWDEFLIWDDIRSIEFLLGDSNGNS